MIKIDDRAEFKGQIIDIFEDFLDDIGVTPDMLPNSDRSWEPDEAIIYGIDYGNIADVIDNIVDEIELYRRLPECVKESEKLHRYAIVENIFQAFLKFIDKIKDGNIFDLAIEHQVFLKNEIKQVFIKWGVFE